MDYIELVGRAQAGDQTAISDLYSGTYNSAYFVAVQMVKNQQEALDILQNAYISAFNNLDRLNKPESFPKWLNQIISNRCKDYLKKKKAILFSDMKAEEEDTDIDFEDDSASAWQVNPQEKMEYTETQRLVREILDSLSDEQRMVTLMYYFEQLSVKEIAETLGCSENTVKSRLNYARKKIKEEVLALEKKGTKLYGLTPIPFFIWLLLQLSQEPQLSVSTAAQVLQNVQQGTAATKSAAAASTSTKAAGAAAKVGLSGKAIVAIVAGVLVVGAVVGVLVSNIIDRSMDEQAESPAVAMAISDANSAEGVSSESILGAVASSELEEVEEAEVDLSGYSLSELVGPVSAVSDPNVTYMGFLVDTPFTRDINAAIEAKAVEYYRLCSSNGRTSTELEYREYYTLNPQTLALGEHTLGGPECRQAFAVGDYGAFTVQRYGNILSIASHLNDGIDPPASNRIFEDLIYSVDLTTSTSLTLRDFAEMYGFTIDEVNQVFHDFDVQLFFGAWSNPNYVFTGDEMCGFTMADDAGTPIQLHIYAPFEEVYTQGSDSYGTSSVVVEYLVDNDLLHIPIGV